MVLAPVFESFIEKRPVCVMARGVLERMLDPVRIDALFERSAVNGFTRDLLFSSLVKLMGDVVLGVRPSVNAAFQSAETDGGVGVSLTAVYNKLDRVEPVVSAALVRDSAEQAAAVIDALGARLPAWLPFSSPIVMPMRMAMGGVPMTHVIGSWIVSALGCAGAIWLAARIYRVGMLMYGKKPSMGELIKWIRYAG